MGLALRIHKTHRINGVRAGQSGKQSAVADVCSCRKEEGVKNLQELTDALVAVKGVLAAAVVDYESGMIMAASEGSGNNTDLEIVMAGGTNIIRAQQRTVSMLHRDDALRDILISLKQQYHLLCPCSQRENMFIYIIIDRKTANLSICRNAMFCAEAMVV